jgi:hypothetical protein
VVARGQKLVHLYPKGHYRNMHGAGSVVGTRSVHNLDLAKPSRMVANLLS